MTNNVFEKGFITKREVKNIVRSEITSSDEEILEIKIDFPEVETIEIDNI